MNDKKVLRKKIMLARWVYYRPEEVSSEWYERLVISDAEYDIMERKYKELYGDDLGQEIDVGGEDHKDFLLKYGVGRER